MPTITAVAADIQTSLHGSFNDLEYLAQLIEDSTITDTGSGNELQNRLTTILDASSDGSNGGVTHFSRIFRGCRDRGLRAEFRDGSNQIGHFMTAVDMGFRPSKTAALAASKGITEGRGWVLRAGINPGDLSDMASSRGTIRFPWEEELCVRLIIGHEQVPDADDPENQWLSDIIATVSANGEEVTTFFGALNRVSLGNADLAATRSALSTIYIARGKGNSMMDLHLSLYGFQLGRFIRKGQMSTRRAAAGWIRWNIGGTFAFVQRN